MPPTLGKVAALPRLGLRPLTELRREAPVRWVAVSELEDPTPFLEGGELVLTVGMRMTPEGAGPYVARLVERGVAGLGFAVGVLHESVPPELVEAARAQGLTLLEVPRPTPFIAVGKAVSRMLAAEEYQDVTRSFQAQRELTRAALKGPGPVIRRLARELGGWALLLDASGEVRHAEPARARRHAAGLAEELARLRPSRPRPYGGAGEPGDEKGRGPEHATGVSGGGPPGGWGRGDGPASVALAGQDGHVVVQPVGLGGRPRGFLAVGTDEPLPPVAHTIVGAAVALLTLQSESPRNGRRLRAALGGLLLGVRPPGAALPEPPLRVLACGGDVLDVLETDPAGEHCLVVPLPEVCAVIVPDRLAGQAGALARTRGPVGVSDPVDAPDSLGRALSQAERALSAARRVREERDSPYGLVRHADLPGQGLLGMLQPEVARGFAEALLSPLYEEDPVLVDSLRAYLAANGQGEAAARALGVHRHTLRARMRRAARSLHRDLDDPAARAELWVALAVLSNDETSIGQDGGSQGGSADIP